MKRSLFVSAIVAALLVPSTALSSSQGSSSASAEAKRGSSLGFSVVTRNGKPKKVTNIQYSDLILNCDVGGPINASGGPYGPARVENKKFKKTFPTTHAGGEGKFTIFGEFKRNFSRIKGYIKKTGDYPDVDAEGCSSGRVEYVAD
jgi:hypothetical protein